MNPSVISMETTIALAVHTAFGGMHIAFDVSANSAPRLDDVDRRLITLLMADGRMGYSELARAVQLPVPTVRRRTLRLISDGLLKIATVRHQGHRRDSASAQLSVVPRKKDHVILALLELPSVDYVTETMGPFDLACEISAASGAELHRLIDRVRSIAGVSADRIEPIEVLNRQLSWGTENTTNAH